MRHIDTNVNCLLEGDRCSWLSFEASVKKVAIHTRTTRTMACAVLSRRRGGGGVSMPVWGSGSSSNGPNSSEIHSYYAMYNIAPPALLRLTAMIYG